MSDQFPPGEEPTRMNPQGGPDPQQPQQWGPPGQQQPSGGQGSWGAPQSGQYPQNPYGQPNPYAQQNPYGQGQQRQWGQQQQQWGQQPGQQSWGQQQPSNKKNLLVIGAIVAVVLLIVGGIGAAIALGGDDDDDENAAGGDTSQSTEPTDEPSVDPTDEPTDEPTGEPTGPLTTPSAPQSSTAPSGSFTAEYQRDLGQVCTGAAMANAKPFDPATTKVAAFLDSPKDADWSGFVSVGINEPFETEYAEFLEVTMVVCVTGAPSASVPPVQCETEDNDGKKVTYTFAPYDYQPVFREAATGQILFEGTEIKPPFSDCPMFAFIDTDGEYTPSVDGDSIDADINAFLKKQ